MWANGYVVLCLFMMDGSYKAMSNALHTGSLLNWLRVLEELCLSIFLSPVGMYVCIWYGIPRAQLDKLLLLMHCYQVLKFLPNVILST